VIWIGLVNGKEILTSFQKQIENPIEKLGFSLKDRPFHPHLTLGRMKSSRGKEELVGRMEKHREEIWRFSSGENDLIKSDLTPSGPIYTLLKELQLGGRVNQ